MVVSFVGSTWKSLVDSSSVLSAFPRPARPGPPLARSQASFSPLVENRLGWAFGANGALSEQPVRASPTTPSTALQRTSVDTCMMIPRSSERSCRIENRWHGSSNSSHGRYGYLDKTAELA